MTSDDDMYVCIYIYIMCVIYIYIYIYILPYVYTYIHNIHISQSPPRMMIPVSEKNNVPPEKKTQRPIGFHTAKSQAGEQLPLQACREKADTKGLR